jgi:hypothetical protein
MKEESRVWRPLLVGGARTFVAVMMAIGRDSRRQRQRSRTEAFGEMVERELRTALKDVKPVDVLSAGLVVAALFAEIISPSAIQQPETPDAEDPLASRRSPLPAPYRRLTGR